jgi:glyoxylase-like metal-dependent hydrolase (beta-lactamase superfamily II)
MSEPSQRARRIQPIAPGLLHWSVHDDRIGARSESYAAVARGRAILVDPLPLTPAALEGLGRVAAIVLTIQSHQRSAWRYRKHFGAPVHAPMGAEGLEEEPDAWYAEGAKLPAGLEAVHAPGPCEASYALRLRRRGGDVLFLGDVLVRGDDGPLEFVPDAYQDAPRKTRASARRLAELLAQIVCPGHGAPIVEAGAEALRAAVGKQKQR